MTTLFSLGWTLKWGGTVHSARVTSLIASRVTLVGTSGTRLSRPPRMRAHAPAKVLVRGGSCSLVAIASSASSCWRLLAAIASVSSTVMWASPPGTGVSASWAR